MTQSQRLNVAASLVAAIAVCLIGFHAYPAIDLMISDYFYTFGDCTARQTPPNCGRFDALHDPFWRSIRSFSYTIPTMTGISMTAYLVFIWFRKLPIARRTFEYILVAIGSLLIGPLIIVNGILKAFWGRPRPYQSENYGGELPFVPPGTITDYCTSNCSFVSGEASAAFWLLVLLFFIPAGWRWLSGGLILAYASGISILRVAFGRHFFSDVVISALLTGLIIILVMAIVQSQPVQRKIDDWLRWRDRARATST